MLDSQLVGVVKDVGVVVAELFAGDHAEGGGAIEDFSHGSGSVEMVQFLDVRSCLRVIAVRCASSLASTPVDMGLACWGGRSGLGTPTFWSSLLYYVC